MRDEGVGAVVLFVLFVLGVGTVGGCMVGYPQYQVYQERLAGEAELARSVAAKQVAVQTALAKKEAAQMLADAEIIRAQGVAQANRIIGESLHGNDAYLRYLWIQNLENGGNQIIYVPTEANLPILEAGKREKP